MYAAGFFDAEGSIWINKFKRKSRLHPSYSLRINVTSTNQLIIQWFKTNFGGSNRVDLRGKSPRFRWDAHGNIATNFLQKVIPYLQIKRSRAKLALQFQAEINKNKIKKNVKYNLTSLRSLRQREQFKNQISALNHGRPETKLKLPSRYGISYTAGLFDGDGSISIFIHRHQCSNHYLRVDIASINQPIIYWLKNYFGGSVYIRKHLGEYHKHRLYSWRAYSIIAENFLQRVLPRLRLKKSRAKLALQFRKEKKQNKRQDGKCPWITLERFKEREQLRNQIIFLNRCRG